ncbi:MAG: DUF4238 domain-containing protein [Chlorobaculum sp.]|nr:DUF4238 domain-containing protein [Chlorobaculum sp.]
MDHFVSQVHLKHFYSPLLGNRMYALRKSDLKVFTPDAYSICRTPDGSTNTYLQEERAIEDFLKSIEPKYNKALANIVTDSVDRESIYVLAGFIAYIITCSPAGMRIHSEPFTVSIEETGRILDASGMIPPPPPELGANSLTELLERGTVYAEIDPKYPQAVGISSILELTNSHGNSSWEILINDHRDSPFFTSDYPVAIEKTSDLRILNKIIPLSPSVAVRIRLDILQDTSNLDLSFPRFRHKVRRPQLQEISKINTMIVRCAETTVFFRDNHDWVQRFVRKHSRFRIEPRTQRMPYPGGAVLWSTQEICKI